MSVASFLARFPEFGEGRAPTDLIEATIAEAARSVSGQDWGERLTDAVYTMAAALLAESPWGQQARLEPGKTTYQQRFEEMRQSTIPGPILAW